MAAQLAAFPDIKTRIVDQKSGPLLLGQADGIACRTMEMFEAFGFSERVMKEAYWVNETTFWKPDDTAKDKIVRHGRIQDVEDGLSEFPHVILNQARVHDFYLDVMRNSASRLEPHYSPPPARPARRDRSAGDTPSHPVTVRLERIDPAHQGQIETVKARMSWVATAREAPCASRSGANCAGDSASQAWGVMDVLAVTDFPDIRIKSLIQSAHEGSILLIPREGGYLVRIYVELDKLNANERVSSRNITIDRLIAAAQRIFRPYTLDVKEVAWWSVYEIGQRLCDKFDDVPDAEVASRLPRVFIAGDACHTHSPKAGQGMNVSMQDAFNLGWKLASVLRGRCAPKLLHTYSAERQAIAKELIDFDREWAKMLSAPLKVVARRRRHRSGRGAEIFRQARALHRGNGDAVQAVAHLRRTAPSASGQRPRDRHALPFGAGHSSRGRQAGSPGRCDQGRRPLASVRLRRCGRLPARSSRMRALCDFLADSPESPVRRYTPAGADIDSVIDVRAVFQQGHRELDLEAMPQLLLPAKGRYGLRDYEKMFCPDLKGGNDIFDMRGIDRDPGCVVVVRPDQYVAACAPARRLCRPFGLLRRFHASANVSAIYLWQPKKVQYRRCCLGFSQWQNRTARVGCLGCRR